MRYGNIELLVAKGSLGFTFAKKQEIRHYPGTDKADAISQGKLPTIITCTLIGKGEEELFLIEQLLHQEGVEQELHFNKYFYKRVTTGETGKPKPITSDHELWEIEAEFIALDPIPYDSVSGEAKY